MNPSIYLYKTGSNTTENFIKFSTPTFGVLGVTVGAYVGGGLTILALKGISMVIDKVHEIKIKRQNRKEQKNIMHLNKLLDADPVYQSNLNTINCNDEEIIRLQSLIQIAPKLPDCKDKNSSESYDEYFEKAIKLLEHHIEWGKRHIKVWEDSKKRRHYDKESVEEANGNLKFEKTQLLMREGQLTHIKKQKETYDQIQKINNHNDGIMLKINNLKMINDKLNLENENIKNEKRHTIRDL